VAEEENSKQVSVPSLWRRAGPIILWIAGGVVAAVLVITAAYYFDVVTESSAFCGQLCHPVKPQYTTHLVSPHANVECGICHVGPGLLPKVTAKINGLQELVSLVTNSYERPLAPPVARLRPAHDICEQCHSPTTNYEDLVRVISNFAANEGNSETRTQLLVHVSEKTIAQGDGSNISRAGAHWHVANPVWYVSRDANHQNSPWVGVPGSDGTLTSYELRSNALSADELQRLPLRQMDCIDCHDRPTHLFRSPDLLVDEALASGRLDRSLPFLKREASKLLGASYPSQEAGQTAMAGLQDFYRKEYASIYDSKAQAVNQAVAVLQDIYRQTVFPEMKVTWKTYPDNIGHKDSLGCFRCHDGKHTNDLGETIPLNCNLCHSVPVIGSPDTRPVASVTFAGSEPSSHQDANFVRDHRVLADPACAECHGKIEYGNDGSSFCANQACHGQKWPGVDLKAGFVHPVALVGQHAQASCADCHKGAGKPQLDDCSSCHKPPQQPHFGQDCSRCHTPEGWKQSAVSWTSNVPTIPHGVVETADCAGCHAPGKSAPAPASHEGIDPKSCLQCHKPGPVAATPNIPHTLEGLANCLVCHAEGKLKPVSADHQGWESATCLMCHSKK
jgi:hypothetical protein